MIQLSFTIPEPGTPRYRSWDRAKMAGPAGIDEMDLRYKYLNAYIEMVVGGVEIISKECLLTLVDLALCVRGVIDDLRVGKDGVIGFTESLDVINFRHAGDNIVVSSSYMQEQGLVDRDELLKEFSKFLQSTYSRIVEEIPEMAENPTIARLSADSRS